MGNGCAFRREEGVNRNSEGGRAGKEKGNIERERLSFLKFKFKQRPEIGDKGLERTALGYFKKERRKMENVR